MDVSQKHGFVHGWILMSPIFVVKHCLFLSKQMTPPHIEDSKKNHHKKRILVDGEKYWYYFASTLPSGSSGYLLFQVLWRKHLRLTRKKKHWNVMVQWQWHFNSCSLQHKEFSYLTILLAPFRVPRGKELTTAPPQTQVTAFRMIFRSDDVSWPYFAGKCKHKVLWSTQLPSRWAVDFFEGWKNHCWCYKVIVPLTSKTVCVEILVGQIV